MAETVHVKGFPAVIGPLELHDTVTTSGCGAILTPVEPVALTPSASVTLKVSANTPLTGSVTENVPVPE